MDTTQDKPINPYWAEKAKIFHENNPHVLDMLRDMALRVQAKGKRRYGIKVLYNALRWRIDVETEDDTPYKLNDAYHAWYARKLMEIEPQLDGFFELRENTAVRARVVG